MATKKRKVETPVQDAADSSDVNIFDILTEADKKKYDYFSSLTDEQKKKFVYFMLTHWMSSVVANIEMQQFYVLSVNHFLNTHLFDENVRNHPELQWKLLCACSPGLGVKRHQWLPNLPTRIVSLKEKADKATVKKYFTSVYSGASTEDVNNITEAYMEENKKKFYIAENFKTMKMSDIEILSQLITDDDIRQNERDKGNE